ncbi:hypothetical protein NQ315_007891 [Exocentrus adspersus]|uniref:SAM domain-containing protein n=1 Tax=Exocentrus adspersus TaxID=1586481 RepID=A0AAV8WAR2_9CUCU|nr:hypothetical protein NQ315_007891 [Exocentrus adspersus]
MDCGQLRDFSEFCEQLNEIRSKFHKWDNCEKTVGLYYLMIGLPFANARFLQHALEQCITSVNTPEAQTLETNANDTLFISNFLTESPQVALSLILTHLPLLKPSNRGAARCYLKTIKQVLTEFITPPLKIYNECIEIMSYVYIHPAFTSDDKKSFKHLLKQVLNKVTPQNFIHSPANESSDESVSPNPESHDFHLKRGDRRSNSLTPAEGSCRENVQPHNENWYSQECLTEPLSKPRSYSLSSEKSLFSHIPNLQSSSSETRLQDLRMMNDLSVMKSIMSWLKSLRLHKYSWVFNNLTYSQMINLTEETLQAVGITKGARHKLLLSISKLKERSSMLTELETEVMNGGDISLALKKLKNVLQSPLQISSEEDLPAQFVKVMGKVCTQLLMLRQPSDDYLMSFSSLCEKAESHDAFTEEQKKRLNMWKSQLLKEEPLPIYNQPHQQSTSSSRMQHFQYIVPKKFSSVQSSYTHKSSSYPNMKNNVSSNGHRHSVGSVTLQNQLLSATQNQYSLLNNIPSYNNCSINYYESNMNPLHVPFQDFNSHKEPKPPQNVDIESSLESLCLQMMEHALGP